MRKSKYIDPMVAEALNDIKKSEDPHFLISKAKDTKIFAAVEQNNVEAVRSLLKESLEQQQPLNGIEEAFCKAVADDNVPIAQLLLEHDPKLVNVIRDGLSPLHLAAEQVFPAMVKLLLKFKANHLQLTTLEEDRGKGCTPLQLVASTSAKATHENIAEIVKMLLAAGADPNQEVSKGKSGRYIYTPLQLVVGTNNLPAVKVLLEHGASCLIPMPPGPMAEKTLLTSAREKKKDVSIIKLLEAYSKQQSSQLQQGIRERIEQGFQQIQQLKLDSISAQPWEISYKNDKLTLLTKDKEVKGLLQKYLGFARNELGFTWSWQDLTFELTNLGAGNFARLGKVIVQVENKLQQKHANSNIVKKSSTLAHISPVVYQVETATISTSAASSSFSSSSTPPDLDREEKHESKEETPPISEEIQKIIELNKKTFEDSLKRLQASEKRRKAEKKSEKNSKVAAPADTKNSKKTPAIKPKILSEKIPKEIFKDSKKVEPNKKGELVKTPVSSAPLGKANTSAGSSGSVFQGHLSFFGKPDFREANIPLIPKTLLLKEVASKKDKGKTKTVAPFASYGVERIIETSLHALNDCLKENQRTRNESHAFIYGHALHYHLLRLTEALTIRAKTMPNAEFYTADDRKGQTLANILIHFCGKITEPEVIGLADRVNHYVLPKQENKGVYKQTSGVFDISKTPLYQKFEKELMPKEPPNELAKKDPTEVITCFQQIIADIPHLQALTGKFIDLSHFAMDPIGVKAATFMIMRMGEYYKQVWSNAPSLQECWPAHIIDLLEQCRAIRNKERHEFDKGYHPTEVDYLVEPVGPGTIFEVTLKLIEHSDELQDLVAPQSALSFGAG